jgi:large subunit ribosomal protein L35
MPKIKTHKGTARRFTTSGGGKFMHVRSMRNNFRRKKAYRVKKLFDQKVEASAAANKRLRKLLPYH